MKDLSVITQNLPQNLGDLSKFALIGREKLVAVRAEIRAIEKVGMAKEVREQKLKEAQQIADVVLDAEVRIGELINAMPKESGGDHGNQYTSGKTPTAGTFAKQDKVTAKAQEIINAGISPKQAERFKVLAKHPEVVAKAKEQAKKDDDIVSRSLVLNMIKQEQRKADIAEQVATIEKGIEKPNGKYDVIVIDPPWNYGTQFNAEGRRVANPYPEMSQNELKALDIPAEDNSVLFLWTTHKFIWDAKELLDTWGFEYRSMLVWDKQKIGMGDLLRMQCEFCLIGIKGKPVFKDNHSERDIIYEARREHSRKPDEFYNLVDRLCAGKKLDYFSREQREGWSNYGNDTNKF